MKEHMRVNKKDKLHKIIAYLQPAISTDESRLIMSGIIIDKDSDQSDNVNLVATDGRRVHYAIIPESEVPLVHGMYTVSKVNKDFILTLTDWKPINWRRAIPWREPSWDKAWKLMGSYNADVSPTRIAATIGYPISIEFLKGARGLWQGGTLAIKSFADVNRLFVQITHTNLGFICMSDVPYIKTEYNKYGYKEVSSTIELFS